MAHHWFIEHRTAFAIRSLEADEEQVFLQHLEGCEECQSATEAIARDLAWLPMATAPVIPRPGVMHRFAETAFGRRSRRAQSWSLATGVAAMLAIAVTLLWANAAVRGVRRSAAEERQVLQWQVAMLRDTLAIVQSADRVRHADITMGAQHGGMVVFADDRSHRWNVVVYGITPHPGARLQLWFITEVGMVRGVEVKSPGSGPAFLTVEMPATGGTVMGAALSMEPVSSAVGPPTGPLLAHLML